MSDANACFLIKAVKIENSNSVTIHMAIIPASEGKELEPEELYAWEDITLNCGDSIMLRGITYEHV